MTRITTSSAQFNKIRFHYLAFPDIVFVNTQVEMELCLINIGSEGNLHKRDQVVIAIPWGDLYTDLVDDKDIICESLRGVK